MLSLSNVSAHQAETYYQKDDYYTQSIDRSTQDAQAKWFGKGASTLRLSTEFQTAEFRALLYGQDLRGNALHARRIDPANHRAATDYTFSAPKSVSIAALIQRDERVIQAHDRAVETALSVMESRYTQTRISTDAGRKKVKTGNLVAAVFRHETSREQDPQLHSHCVVMNVTQLPDRSWRSMSNEAAIAHQKLLGEIYQNELAFQLQQCGYGIEVRRNGQFELKGYEPKILDIYSSRTHAIKAHLEQWEQAKGEVATPAQRKAATLKTRENKAKEIDREALLQQWQAELETHQLRLPNVPNHQPALIDREFNAAIAVNAGVNHHSERESLFRRSQVERFALEHHLGEQSFSDLQIAFEYNPDLILVDVEQDRYTTVAAIDRERQTIQMMRDGQGKFSAIASLNDVRQFTQHSTLTDEQRHAIELSATTTDQTIAWQGVAGAGKTYGLYCLGQIAIAQGYQVRGFAPSAEAANGLAQGAEIRSETVVSLLNAAPRLLPGKELWIVDEAGLLGAKDAHDLLKRATQQQARVVFVGDTRQLSAIQAGNPFKALQEAGIAIAHFDKSLRQKTPTLKSAIAQIAQGEIEVGMRALIDAGHILEIPDPMQQLMQLVTDYLQLLPEQRQNTLVMTTSNLDRIELTQQIRAGLQATHELSRDIYQVKGLRTKDVTIAQAQYTKYYAAGDVLVFHQTYKKQGLEKQQAYQVIAVQAQTLILKSKTGKLIQIEPSQCEKKTVYQAQWIAIANGDRLRWTKNDPKAKTRNGQAFVVNAIDAKGNAAIAYEDGNVAHIQLGQQHYLDYAWVNTVYGSQGKTADRVLAAVDRTVSRESFYVTVSRAKRELSIYTTNQAELIQRAQVSRAKETALSLYKEIHHAQSSQIPSNQHTDDSVHGRDAGSRLGASLAATLRSDRQLGSSIDRLRHSTSADPNAIELLSRTVAAVAHQRRTDRHLKQLGGLLKTINLHLEYLTVQAREQLASESEQLSECGRTHTAEHPTARLSEPEVSRRQPFRFLTDLPTFLESRQRELQQQQVQEVDRQQHVKDDGLEL